MADGTKIEWTDATWNPITGCSIKSPGCINCYAQTLAGTRLRNIPSRKGLTDETKNGPVFNGKLRFNEEWLTKPLHWKRPRRVFVCAHGDLFHENAPDEWIDKVFAVMALAGDMGLKHQFQVLTKRADRMRSYIQSKVGIRQYVHLPQAHAKVLLQYEAGVPRNIWLGVSAERQKEADERIPLLAETPAAVRFIRAEPLIGPIDLEATYRKMGGCEVECQIDWVIVGGESGKRARPMHPAWARKLRDQCAAAGVPFFFKQWGEFEYETRCGTEVELAKLEDNERAMWGDGKSNHVICRDVGKKAAGRLLDGVEHSEFPA